MKIKTLKLILLISTLPLIGAGCTNNSKPKPVPPGGAYISTDKGRNWTQISNYPGGRNITAVTPQKVLMDPFDKNIVYMATGTTGLLKFNRTSNLWTQVPTPTSNLTNVVVHSRNPNIIFVAGSPVAFPDRNKIWKTFDAGSTWQEIYTEPTAKSTSYGIFTKKITPKITGLEIDPQKPEILFASSSSGALLMTQDGGTTWSNHHTFQQGIGGLRIYPSNNNFIFVVLNDGSLVKWDESAKQGKKLSIKDGSVKASSIFSMFFPQNKQQILIGTDHGVFTSSDIGETWDILPLPITENQQVSVTSVTAETDGTIFAGSNYVLYSSKDNGQTWQVYQFAIANPLRYLLSDPVDPNIVYAFFLPVK